MRPLSERAVEILLNYDWPGNVRQLRNFVSRMAVSDGIGEIGESEVMQFIEEQGFAQRHLPVVTGQSPHQAEFQLIYQALLSLGQEVRSLRDLIVRNLPQKTDQEMAPAGEHADTARTMDDMEEDLIRATLDAVGGNRREARPGDSVLVSAPCIGN
jgi:DNA-binding NtrC family response regulator